MSQLEPERSSPAPITPPTRPFSATFPSDLLSSSHLLLFLPVTFLPHQLSSCCFTPCSPFLSFSPSLTLIHPCQPPKYTCHLSISSPPILLSPLKSFSISLCPPSSSHSRKPPLPVTSPPLRSLVRQPFPVAPAASCQSTT